LPLALPVSFGSREVEFAQLLPIARMLRAPLLRAVQASLPIHRIGGDLPPVVVVAALSLAGRIAAGGLSRLKFGRLK